MTQKEFMNELRKRMKGVQKKDVDKTVEFYSEVIADRVEEGMTEEEAVAALGRLDEIVDNARPEPPVQDKQSKRSLRWFGWGIAAILALCLLVGGITMAEDLFNAIDDWSYRTELTREVGELTSIEIYPKDAEVEIRFHNKDIVKIVGREEIVSQYRIIEYKGELKIEIAMGNYSTENDNMVIYVPSGDYSLMVWSDSGDIEIKGYTGSDLKLYSMNGDIDLQLKGNKTDYTVEARSAYGEIDAVSGNGDKMVEVATDTGDIEVNYTR